LTPASAAAGGTKLWVAKHPAGDNAAATATAASPDGSRVYVTGNSLGPGDERDNFVTIAYNTATGAQLWLASYNSGRPGTNLNYDDFPLALAVSPDGTKVFVTGWASVGTANTVAYDAATGAQLWVKRYFGAGRAITVSPDSSTVFITGDLRNATTDYATTAYQASTGTRLWQATWAGPDNLNDFSTAIGLTPDGSRVVVTGYNETNDSGREWLTVAYSAATGTQLWFNRYNAAVGAFDDSPGGLVVSPNGSFVAVAGSGRDASTGDMTVIAYDLSTGDELWLGTYHDPRGTESAAAAVAVSPDSTTVFVTGSGRRSVEHGSFETVAFDAATGAFQWATPYDGPPGEEQDNFATAVTVTGDGATVVVTGASQDGPWRGYDFATLAYDTTTGAQLWVTRHNSTIGSHEVPAQLAIIPGADRVAVTGQSRRLFAGQDSFLTAMIAL
jgi:DNA-binding beta-propeller fold protein YncE